MQRKAKKPFRLSYRNRSLSFTPLGTRFVVVCLLIGVAAINTGSNLLYLCTAMMLSMVLVSGILSEQSLRHLRAARSLPEELYAGVPFSVRYTIENMKRRIPTLALGMAGYPQAGTGAGAFVLRVPPGGSAATAAGESVPRRGRWVTEGFELTTAFPFGFFRKSLRVSAREERLVYPRPAELPFALPRSVTQGLGEAPAGRIGQGAELWGFRDYRPGDDARLIHWKSSARLSRLMVREFEAERKRAVTVVLDDMPPADAKADFAERFEEAVSLAAAAVRSLVMEHGVPVAFYSRGAALPAGTGHAQYAAIMEALSLIQPFVPGPDDATGAGADEALARVMNGGPCVMVLASRGSGWSRLTGGASLVLEAGR